MCCLLSRSFGTEIWTPQINKYKFSLLNFLSYFSEFSLTLNNLCRHFNLVAFLLQKAFRHMKIKSIVMDQHWWWPQQYQIKAYSSSNFMYSSKEIYIHLQFLQTQKHWCQVEAESDKKRTLQLHFWFMPIKVCYLVPQNEGHNILRFLTSVKQAIKTLAWNWCHGLRFGQQPGVRAQRGDPLESSWVEGTSQDTSQTGQQYPHTWNHQNWKLRLGNSWGTSPESRNPPPLPYNCLSPSTRNAKSFTRN